MGDDELGPGTGGTLAARLRAAPVTVDEAIRLTAAVADEVAALHAAGRAHAGIDPSTVLIGRDGSVRLTGAHAAAAGLAAPPALRADDLRGVGRVLAAALGWPEAEDLPVPVAGLVLRAEATTAPASSLAEVVQRLAHEPAAVAALLPHHPVPARRAATAVGGLAHLVPLADRRTTGVAAAIVAGAAAVGAVLLLVGTPASTAPPAAAAATARPFAPAPEDRVTVADAAQTPIQAILATGADRAAPIAPRTARRPTAVDAERLTPTIQVAVPTAAPTAAPSTTAAPVPTTDPAPTATTPAPAPSGSAPAPEPTQEPTAAPAPAPTTDPVPPTTPPAAEPTAPAAPVIVPSPAPSASAAG